MKNLKIIAISLMILVSSTGVFGKGLQQWTDVNKDALSGTLASINNHFARMLNYTVNVTDESFTSYTSNTFHEKYSGYFKRDKESFHSYMGGIHTIQNKDCRIAVDSSKRIIMVSDPVDYLDKVLPLENYTNLLKMCIKAKASHSGNVDAYRLEFGPGNPIAAYEITVKDSMPEKIVIYYSKAVKAANENSVDKPRLEIYFENWVMGTIIPKADFNMERYLDKQGNNYVLKPPYSARYKLLDERVQTRNTKK